MGVWQAAGMAESGDMPKRRQALRATGKVDLAVADDGRRLSFDRAHRVFELDGSLCGLEDVRALDGRALLSWRYLEQRDWMRRIDGAAYAAAFEQRASELGASGDASELDEKIRQHVRKNDSYLHGRIVDTSGDGAPPSPPGAAAPASASASGEADGGGLAGDGVGLSPAKASSPGEKDGSARSAASGKGRSGEGGKTAVSAEAKAGAPARLRERFASLRNKKGRKEK